MQFDFEFRSRRSNIMAMRGVAASSQPLASLAGLKMLRAGGTAADAAVAIAAALNVVEPFSTGIGGDMFALYWDAKQKKVFALNGSGPAAQSASIEDLKKAGFDQFPHFTGHAVNVPGTVAGWSALLDRFGRISLQDVLAPAVHYALEGYPVTEWISLVWRWYGGKLLRETLDEDQPKHLQHPGPSQPSGGEFLIDGRIPRAGEMIRLRTLGETLQRIGMEGKAYFYEGDFPKKLSHHVQKYGGWLTPEDLSGFEAEWVEPIYADYHGVRLFECPPNGQGLAAIMAARIADGFDLGAMDQVDRTHTLIECIRFGFQEALNWVADPHFAPAPLERLISEGYVQSLRERIKQDQAVKYLPTVPQKIGEDTVYMSVVDGEGNACSLINSLYYPTGSGLVVPGTGVFLQNRAALFRLDCEHPNALEGGKRPYHTIIPGMMTREGQLMASFGVMGGYMQPQAHLQVLSNLVDLNHNPQQALDMPRFRLRVDGGEGVGADEPGGEVMVEKGFSFDNLAALRQRGHRIAPMAGERRLSFGGGQVILRNPDTGVLIAGSDPRKDGAAIGW